MKKNRDHWNVVHAYMRFSNENLVEPLECRFDDERLFPVINKENDLSILKCPECFSLYPISEDLWAFMEDSLYGTGLNF